MLDDDLIKCSFVRSYLLPGYLVERCMCKAVILLNQQVHSTAVVSSGSTKPFWIPNSPVCLADSFCRHQCKLENKIQPTFQGFQYLLEILKP